MIYGCARTWACLAGRGLQRSEKERQRPGEPAAVILQRGQWLRGGTVGMWTERAGERRQRQIGLGLPGEGEGVKGAGGWRLEVLLLRQGDQEGRVWDMCPRCLEMALQATRMDQVAREEVGRAGVWTCVTHSSDSLRPDASPHHE